MIKNYNFIPSDNRTWFQMHRPPDKLFLLCFLLIWFTVILEAQLSLVSDFKSVFFYILYFWLLMFIFHRIFHCCWNILWVDSGKLIESSSQQGNKFYCARAYQIERIINPTGRMIWKIYESFSISSWSFATFVDKIWGTWSTILKDLLLHFENIESLAFELILKTTSKN